MNENDDDQYLGEGPLGGYAKQVPLETPYPVPAADGTAPPQDGPLGPPSAPVAEPMVQSPPEPAVPRESPNYTQDEQSPDITPNHPAAPVAQQAPLVRVRTTSYDQGGADKEGNDADTEAGRTSTGAPLIEASDGIAGTAAVDPRVIPYGSVIRTADGRVYVASDTGGAVKSMKASGGRAPVVDIFNGQHHPDWQDVQIFKPSADYRRLSPSDKLAYHEQAAQTFAGLAPGQHYKGIDPGQADPEKLTPENIDREIAAAASAPGGLQARRGRAAAAPPSAPRMSSSDPEIKEVRGFITPQGFMPHKDGDVVNEVPIQTTIIDKKTGDEVTYPTDDYGNPDLKHPPKRIPASQVSIAQQLRAENFPDTLTNEVYKRTIANNSVRGAAQMTTQNVIDSMKAEIALEKQKGVTLDPVDALGRVKMARPAEIRSVVTKFANLPEVKPMVQAGGMIDGFNDLDQLRAMPAATRTQADDEAIIAALAKINQPGKGATDADRKALRESLASLSGDITKKKNYLFNYTGSAVTDEKLAAAYAAAERVFNGSRTGYNEQYEAARQSILAFGGTEETVKQQLGANRVDEVLAQSRARAQQRAAGGGAAPGTPSAGATPAASTAPQIPEQLRKEIAQLPEAAKGNDGRIKIEQIDPKTGRRIGPVRQIEPDYYGNLKSEDMQKKGWRVALTP